MQSRRNWSCSNFLLKAFELFTICKDMLSICFDIFNLVFDADGAEESGFADRGQHCFANPVDEVFRFGFIRAKDQVIKTGFDNEIGLSFALNGGKFYHH